jgi:putative Holliday junction resolvase
MVRILAVDPGLARIGLAISDPTETIARPLTVIKHSSRQRDATTILEVATEQGAEKVVVGVALDQNGEVGPQARTALRLVEALRAEGNLIIDTWDESGSTQAAQRGRKSDPMLDARAAAVILQEYLDAHQS